MKKLNACVLYFVFTLLFIIQSSGQNNDLINKWDSVLNNGTDQVQIIKAHNELAWEYRKYDSAKAHHHAFEGRKMAEQLGLKRHEAESWIRIGNIYEIRNIFAPAIDAYKTALKIENKIKHDYGIARANHQIGVVLQKQGKFFDAIAYENKSIEYFKKLKKYSKALAKVYNSNGNNYKWLGKFEESLNQYNRALEIRLAINDRSDIANSYNNIGLLYETQKRYRKALEVHFKSLKINKSISEVQAIAISLNNVGNSYFHLGLLDSAEYYYQKCLELSLAGDLTRKSLLISSYQNLAIIHEAKAEYKDAELLYKKLLQILNENQNEVANKPKQILAHQGIAKLFFAKNDYSNSLIHAKTASKLAQEIQTLTPQIEINKSISQIYQALGKPDSALHNLLIANELKDSLSREEKKAFDFELKYNEIQHIKKSLEAENNRKTILLYSGLITGLLLLFSGLLHLRESRSRQRATLAENQVQLKNEKINYLLKDQELKTISAMLEGKEEERHRIAKDLHDGLGGILSMVKFHFQSIETQIDELKAQNYSQYRKANELLDRACNEVRHLAHNIGDKLLLNLGLKPALEDLVDMLESDNNLDVYLQVADLDERLSQKTERNLYKIIQEFVSNVLKHSCATELSIQIIRFEESMILTIEDNGIGFDPNTINEKNGMGYTSVRSRLSEINGEMKVDSGKGAGTTITIELPLND